MESYGHQLHYFTWAKQDRKGIQYQQRSHYRKSWKQVAMFSVQMFEYDAWKCWKKDAHDIEITAKMFTSCKAVCSRYVIALEKAKKPR